MPRRGNTNEQLDLTDLVDVEHIDGSMPADDTERKAAAAAFYETLSQHPAPERW